MAAEDRGDIPLSIGDLEISTTLKKEPFQSIPVRVESVPIMNRFSSDNLSKKTSHTKRKTMDGLMLIRRLSNQSDFGVE